MRFPVLGVMLCSSLLLASNTAAAVESISLQALFKDKAIVVVDGARRVLRSGEESPEGVKLLATDTQEEKAEIEIGGKREVLKLGVVIAGFASQGRGNVTLYPDRGGHFFVDGLVNGTSVRFMVDTGATVIAMNSVVANRIGIDYRKTGQPGMASTPAGYVQTYNVTLGSVQVGGITLHNVAGSVIEGNHPREALLGMSFLGHLDMKRDNEKMELSER
ncbi:aspartyl protease [Sulfuricaulis limicola]|uniref:Aspartyl protease n=2 Tax=Sulfuricaulis limicola TaxID=1620215 RepID=A0A1B4XDD8_9GAMM|nr:aspartyl protease [Sulfuricaulis limicola]